MEAVFLKIGKNSNVPVVNCFYDFAMGYVKTQTTLSPLRVMCLDLKCVDDDTVSICVTDGFSVISNSFSMGYVMQDPNLIKIVKYYETQNIVVDSFSVYFSQNGLEEIYLNRKEPMGYYVLNKETGKLEMYLDKGSYDLLPDKSQIKSAFLFSNKKKAWVSRAKFPNLWRPTKIAILLGLENRGSYGETLSFAEQMERKAEKAEARAERYEIYSERAKEQGEALQKPLNNMHGDTAFFTQPNINSSSGRAFTRRRNKMFAAYEKGFEEFKKSEYYKDKAETARATASSVKPTDKAFCERRIQEAEKAIQTHKKNLDKYNKALARIQAGERISKVGGYFSEDEVLGYIERTEDIIDQAISKSVYYHECLEELGGVMFSKENIKKGYIVKHQRWGKCKVSGTGPKNFSYVILEEGARGMGGYASYAEIVEVLSTDIEEEPIHPFKVGETYTVKQWDGNHYADKKYIVVKTTKERVTLKCGDEKAISRKPRMFEGNNTEGKFSWAISICDGLNGTIYKSE